MPVIRNFFAPHSSAQEKIVDIKEKKNQSRYKKKPALLCDCYRRQTANPHSWVLVSAQPGKRREGLLWARCLPVLAVEGSVAASAGERGLQQGLASGSPRRAPAVAANTALSQSCTILC